MTQADPKAQAFLAKFRAAAVELEAPSHTHIESLKFRDSVSHNDYRQLITALSLLEVKQIQGDYQGNAWKITDADDSSILIVEHETGLEILYVVGAVASIVSLVPMVVNTWIRLRDHWPPFRGRLEGAPQIRRLSQKGKLTEEPAPPVELMVIQHFLRYQDALNQRITRLETKVSSLTKLLSEHGIGKTKPVALKSKRGGNGPTRSA